MVLSLSRSLLLTAVTLGAGCVVQVDYAPRTTLVNELGFEQAANQLAAVVNRARRPILAEVSVQPESLIMTTAGGYGWWGLGYSAVRELFFSNLSRIDIFGNGRTFVYDVNRRRVAQLDFVVLDDCMLFADLMMSFRAWDGGRGGDPWPEPGAPQGDAYVEPEPGASQGDDYVEPEPADPETGTTRHVLEGE